MNGSTLGMGHYWNIGNGKKQGTASAAVPLSILAQSDYKIEC